MRPTYHALERRFLLILFILFAFTACFLFVPRFAADTRAASLQSRAASAPQETRPAPTPTPSPPASPKQKSSKLKSLGRRVLDFLACNTANKSKERELSRNGMKFPDEFNMSDFSIEALVKGNWAVTVEYELEPSGTVQITFQAKDVEPFTQTLSVQDGKSPSSNTQAAGNHREVTFYLPKEFGERPQPALISFKALADGPNGKVPAEFELIGLGIGDTELPLNSASFTQPRFQTIGISAPSWGFSPLEDVGNRQPHTHVTWAMGPPAVRIVKVSVRPNTVDTLRGGIFEYKFISADRFPSWRADFFREVVLSVNGRSIRTPRHVQGVKFQNEEVDVGENPKEPPSPRQWVIRRGGVVPRGQYKIQVTAFWAINAGPQGGKSAFQASTPPVTIY